MDVRARDQRPLKPKRYISPEGLLAIREAQRARWALAKRKERERAGPTRSPTRTSVDHRDNHPANWDRMTVQAKQRWYYAQKQAGKGKAVSTTTDQKSTSQRTSQSAYWAQFTPEQRVRMAAARRRKAEANRRAGTKWSKPKVSTRGRSQGQLLRMGKGFWLAETTKELKEPRPQIDVYHSLIKKYPDKRSAISVAIATMKRNKELVEVGGLLQLPGTTNGAVAANA